MPTNRHQNPVLPGSHRAHAPGAARVADAPADQVLAVSLILRFRPDAPTLPDMDHWANTPPRQRRYLPRHDHGAALGADPADVAKVVAFANDHGLTVVGHDLRRRRVDVTGTVTRFNAAFDIALGIHGSGATRYHGHDRPLRVPRDLIGVILAVFGLDGRRIARHMSAASLAITPLTPPDVARLYGFPAPPADMTGQTIGILEFGGGFAVDAAGRATDVDAYLAGLTPPPPRPGILTPTVPRVTPEPRVANAPGTDAAPAGADGEVALDIDVVAAVAPGAPIAVYFANFTESGWLDAIQAAILPRGREPAPSVITISWGADEAAWGVGQLQTLSAHFQHAAAMGVSVFAASGDDGSMGNSAEPDGRAHVIYPAADPWVTAVGGTTIANVSGAAFEEGTWTTTGALQGLTGGGVSTRADGAGHLVFPLPSWQRGAGVPPSINDGTTRGRGVPDIAGYANGYEIVVHGARKRYSGTSEAAPLYAALAAILNARLGFNLGWLNPTIYQMAATPGFDIVRDIDDGASNAATLTLAPPDPPETITAPGYKAVKGWDACTGWGSLKATRFYAALGSLPLLAASVVDHGQFGDARVGAFVDATLTIGNTGFAPLAITAITSSSLEFRTPGATALPLLVPVGHAIDVTIRFQPSRAGARTGTLTIVSNDPGGPHGIAVCGEAMAARRDQAMAGHGASARCA